MTNRTDIYMRLGPLKLFLTHLRNPPFKTG
jgi:hypothetical protein